ncbi:hypothetical protein BpHYR1_036078 [Brachionus plicatilis]|uniref:Uncharacterized protein n=1 Tax=Brachionus plicatilis TaxID=10195 RepID=A0A3M7R9Y7_BRAPC|nr:hypothetical protein BpHYR1_036078 [Brachionus plicatilis]
MFYINLQISFKFRKNRRFKKITKTYNVQNIFKLVNAHLESSALNNQSKLNLIDSISENKNIAMKNDDTLITTKHF